MGLSGPLICMFTKETKETKNNVVDLMEMIHVCGGYEFTHA